MTVDTGLPVGVHEVSETLNYKTRRLFLIDFKVSDEVMDIIFREVSILSVHVPTATDFGNVGIILQIDVEAVSYTHLTLPTRSYV